MARLLLAVVLLLGLRVAQTSAQGCAEDLQLQGYDITALAEQSYWQFQVPLGECIPKPNRTECQVEFSICHDVASEACSKPSTAVCMSIEVNSTSNPVVSYSLGQSIGSVSRPNPSDVPEGFAFNFSNGDNFPNCIHGAQIMMVFQCDEKAIWGSNNNITKFVHFDWIDDTCLFAANLSYSGACFTESPVNDCALSGYDVTTLSGPTAWIASPSSGKCYFADGYTPIGGETCTLYFSFCKSLTAGSCTNSVFCEVFNQGKSIVSYSFGTFSPTATIQANDDDSGFVFEYEGGTQTDNCQNGVFGIVSFVCNASANWTYLINNNVTEYMEIAEQENFCQYDVVFQYDGACYTGSSSSSPSIVGWVLMAVVVGIALIYLISGIVVQYVRGRRGIELIPNVDFWKLFLILVLEGCRFTLDIITCYQLHSISNRVTKVDYEAL